MISVKNVAQAVEDKIEGTGLFLVEVAVKSGNRIFVEVDKDPAVSIAELASLNRYLESVFDREEEDHDLRVSSPGLDRPLRHAKQFAKHNGRDVKVILNDGRTVEGEMSAHDDAKVVLITKKKVKGKKELEKNQVELMHDDIKETRLIVKLK